jgi:DNA polymerase-3 subunit chi
MNTATFYIVEQQTPQNSPQGFEAYVLFIIRHFVSQGAKVYLNTDSKQQAEYWDDLLWQQKAEQFMAHHLIGEGPKNGTPLEVGYSQLKPSWNRQLVINLAKDNTNFAGTFTQVIDFVPCNEKEKQLARERYKQYRQAGYQMQTVDIDYQD